MCRLKLCKFIYLSLILIILITHLAESTPSVYKSITRKISVIPGNNISISELYVSLTLEGNGTYPLIDKTFIYNTTEINFYNGDPEEIRRNSDLSI